MAGQKNTFPPKKILFSKPFFLPFVSLCRFLTRISRLNLKTYDYIIAGAGAAGLSLAYYMAQTTLKSRSVLLLDMDAKRSNDRTWCFWAPGATAHDDIVCHKWKNLYFNGDQWQRGGELGALSYQMIRGADFYDKMRQELGRSPSFEFRQEKVLSIVDCGEGAKVETANASYWAPVVFNSCLRPKVSPQPGTHFLLQHFTGWWIETAEDQFDPRSGILMDFRTPQYGSARFFYLLPISKRRALVEYTIFSPEKLQPHHYEEALQKYLKEQCGLNNYRVYERESGAIPMTDKVMPSKYSKYTVNIGTFGGAVKPTTGYAFQNIQRQAKQLVAQMEAGEALDSRLPQQPRFRFYDRLLLNILQHFGEEAKGIFCRLFRYSSMPHILRFLEEKTHLWQEVRIFATLPIITFLRAVVRVYVSRPRSVRSIQPEKRKDVLPTVRAKRKTKKVV